VRTIGVDERRARLGRRQRSAIPPAELAASLVALHATDPATVFLSVTARSGAPAGALEQALYDDRSLLRMLGMRRTMFVLPVELAGVVQAACTDDVAARLRTLLVKHLAEGGIAPDPPAAGRWLRDVEESTAAALTALGAATPAQLGEAEPRLRERLEMAAGKKYASQPFITNRVLTLLAAEGRIVRGRPRGSWLSTQYLWHPADTWAPGALTDPPPADQARADLARHWLRAFGPATGTDLQWWAGWTVTNTRKALAAVEAVEVDLDGVPGWVLPDDLDPVAPADPWVALLPALDPTPMGWKQRGWYLGPHEPDLFDTNGNIGPTIWADGRIVGGWSQTPDAQVVTALLEDVPRATRTAIDRQAARLSTWLDGTRVIPRFRTPLERTLAT
jgi:Winged helix DNA-binding domain